MPAIGNRVQRRMETPAGFSSGNEEAVDQRDEQHAERDVQKVSDYAGTDVDGEPGTYLIADDVGYGKRNPQTVDDHAAGGEHGEGSGIGGEVEHLCRSRGTHEAHAENDMLGNDEEAASARAEKAE